MAIPNPVLPSFKISGVIYHLPAAGNSRNEMRATVNGLWVLVDRNGRFERRKMIYILEKLNQTVKSFDVCFQSRRPRGKSAVPLVFIVIPRRTITLCRRGRGERSVTYFICPTGVVSVRFLFVESSLLRLRPLKSRIIRA